MKDEIFNTLMIAALLGWICVLCKHTNALEERVGKLEQFIIKLEEKK